MTQTVVYLPDGNRNVLTEENTGAYSIDGNVVRVEFDGGAAFSFTVDTFAAIESNGKSMIFGTAIALLSVCLSITLVAAIGFTVGMCIKEKAA